jgi:hypothetical protein
LLSSDVAEGPALANDTWDWALNLQGFTGGQMLERLSFAKFDGLPELVRHTLHQTIVMWDPVPIARYLDKELPDHSPSDQRGLINVVTQLIVEADERALVEYARKYKRKYKHRMPHLAAKATIMLYDEARLHAKRRSLVTDELHSLHRLPGVLCR